MVRTHRDDIVGAALVPAARLLIHQKPDQRHHIHPALEMVILEKGTACLDRDIAKMREMHPFGKGGSNRQNIIVRPRAERSGAKGDSVRQRRHRIEQCGIVRLRRYHPRHAEDGKWRIIGMKADADAAFLGGGRDLCKEADQVGAKLVCGQPVIFGNGGADALAAVRQFGSRKAGDDGGFQPCHCFVIHGGVAGFGLPDRFGVIIRFRTGPAQHEEVVNREFQRVEPQREPAATRRIAQVGPRPVDHRHEVIADDLEPLRGKVAHGLDPAGDMSRRTAVAKLDGGMHRDAFHHRPAQPGILDEFLAGGDIVRPPDLARRHGMQRRDDAIRAGLPDVGTCHRIIRSEPSPGFKHPTSPLSTLPARKVCDTTPDRSTLGSPFRRNCPTIGDQLIL